MKKIMMLALLAGQLHASAPAKPKQSPAGMSIQQAAKEAAQGQVQYNPQQQGQTRFQKIAQERRILRAQIEALKADLAKSDKQYAEKLVLLEKQNHEMNVTLASLKISMSIAQTNHKLFQDKVYALERAAQKDAATMRQDATTMQQFMNSWTTFAYHILLETQQTRALVNTAIAKGVFEQTAQSNQQPVYWLMPLGQQQVSTSPATASTASAASTPESASPEMAPLTLSAQQKS